MNRDPLDLPRLHVREDLGAEIPESLREADDALTRYGRWATQRTRGGRAPTLDRMHIREADHHESLEAYLRRRAAVPQARTMPVGEALICQRSLARVPDRERVVLSVLYIPRRLPPHVQLEHLRIPAALCKVRHLAGLRMFANLRQIATLQANRT